MIQGLIARMLQRCAYKVKLYVIRFCRRFSEHANIQIARRVPLTALHGQIYANLYCQLHVLQILVAHCTKYSSNY